MDIRQLTYFVEVVRLGSITAASDTLNVSQPAISVSLRKLETEIGAPLLSRSPAGVQATVAGRELLPRAEAILARIDEAVTAARAASCEGPRRLRIAIPPIVGMYAIIDLLENFIPEHPEIDLVITEGATAQVLEEVEKGQVDIAVAITPTIPSGCTLWTQVAVPIVAYVSPQSPIAQASRVNLADFDGYPFVLMGAGAQISNIILDEIRSHGVHPQIVHWTVQLTTLFALAGRDAAVAFSTENVSQLTSEAVPVRTEPELSEVVSIFVSSHLPIEGVVRHLLDRITAKIEGI
ncbi:LysR family transcriptional regulator [Trueperella sp. LYQ143]|uniref:LysR family transcriptional regulator n=1 Tax=unclassified Trueperella TaxID=2630174 RepID=UPI0039839C9E